MSKETLPLSYPLPLRQWVQLANGKWTSQQWTSETRALAEAGRYKIVDVSHET